MSATEANNLMPGAAAEDALVRLVDDDADFLEGLAFVLEAKGWTVAAYQDPMAFLKADRPSMPGCLILDIRMPGMSGIELQAEMKARGIDLPVIILTGHADVDSAVKTLKMGATDFLQKPVNSDDLFDAVANAMQLSRARRLGGLDKASLIDVISRFSAREKAVTRLLREGLVNSAIAERLGLTAKTVQNYRNTVYGKLRVHNTDELMHVFSQVESDRLSKMLAG